MKTAEQSKAHTALPCGCALILDGAILCAQDVNGLTHPLTLEQKKAVLRAANSHYQLLSALKACAAILRRDYPGVERTDVFKAAEQAISQAEEGL